MSAEQSASAKGWTWAVVVTVGTILLTVGLAFTALPYLACPQEFSPLPNWVVARSVDGVVWMDNHGVRFRCPRCRRTWITVTLSMSWKMD